METLYEDNHLLAVNKPAGLPTMGVQDDVPSLLSEAKQYVKHRYRKPGNVYLGIVSRLDTPVSGVVLLAKTSKAASRLAEQFRNRSVKKTYWAVVEGRVDPGRGALRDYLRKDERHRRMHIASAKTPNAKEAKLTYHTLCMLDDMTFLEIQLETGRKHQIRLQFAHRGNAVVGDRKYGSKRSFPDGIALHSRVVTVIHPVRREPLTIEAPLPGAWRKLGAQDRIGRNR
jgi:23S rRNA pseudouridine1911/1915/1917 synthase